MSHEPIQSKMPTPVAIFIALVLVGFMVGSGYYLYEKNRNPAPISAPGAIPPPSSEMPQEAAPQVPTSEGGGTVNVPQVAKVMALNPLATDDFPMKDGIIRFRSASGNEICAWADDLAKLHDDRWVVLTPNPDGQYPTGPGIACSQVRGELLPRPEDRRACPSRSLVGRAATLTRNDVAFGACLSGRNPASEDANSEQDKRFEITAVPNGSYVKLGDFACGGAAPDFVCVQTTTGRGFSLRADHYDLYQPAQ
ncbi:hypothetical protein BK816_02495 [Boudabousia tangfeifanii]|uniref:Uncharacterized protein n=1 Tax=Boudabousia tangfeifanii TaxID=1912795 RepID=A0A1D9MJC2_9ACTO|nr:hypothetical protein [Boudabousia tangfeifanii]AOZ72308.1 hypothetical protein BK816_02495 [Boudabousia tangfeifanii]